MIAALCVIVCAASAQQAAARNVRYLLKIQEVLDSPAYNERVGSDVRFAFADQHVVVGATIEEYVVDDRLHFKGRSDEGTCRDTLLLALANLRDEAKSRGGDAVIGIVSYFRRQTFSSATEFACHAGSRGVFVSLKGTIAKLRK